MLVESGREMPPPLYPLQYCGSGVNTGFSGGDEPNLTVYPHCSTKFVDGTREGTFLPHFLLSFYRYLKGSVEV